MMNIRPARLRWCPSSTFVAVALAVLANGAQAITVDAKALARFDISFSQCEKQIPQMRGRRDEAWLSLWRARADDSSRADLAKARKSGVYVTEHRRVLQAQAAGRAPAASSPVNRQCQALWAETQRVAKEQP